MLHKIFKKRSFRRPHKNVDYNISKGDRENADDSDSFDNSSIIGTTSPIATSNGLFSGAPIATQEEGGVSSETESLKKVTFTEPVTVNPVNDNDNDKRAVSTDLFDGNVLQAFQTGDISIADFLKTPSQSPKKEAKKKNRSLSDCGPPRTELWHRMAGTAPKKQTLLDRAHSMKSKSIPKRSMSLSSRTQNADTAKTITETEAGDDGMEGGNNNMRLPIPHALNGDRKHRFSTSLETLAQEVFGDEYQKYLAGASNSPVPKKLPLAQRTTGEISSNGIITTAEETRHLKVHKPVPLGTKKLESLHVDVSLGASDSRLKSSISFNSRGENCHKLMNKSSSTCKSLDISSMEVVGSLAQNLESWSNNTDLSNTSYSSVNSINDEVTDHLQRMKPIMEDKVDHGPSRLSVDRSAKENGLNDLQPHPITTSNQLEFVYRRKIGRLSTSDSQYVNVGSFNDGDRDIDVTESSLMDIHFPPPPPVEEEQLTPLYTEGYDTQPYHDLPSYSNKQTPYYNEQSFDSDPRYTATASPDYNFDFTSDAVDPLIESLTSIVPLPDDHEQLVPVLSKALCEIVSEIIASRRKLKRMMKAIEIHQQVLKDQNRQIQKQNKEIAELRKTAYALNNLHILSRESMEPSPAPNKLHTRSRESMDNSPAPNNLHSCSRESVENLPASSIHRGSSENIATKAPPDRKNRQSREMVELNMTLDKLLHQCSTLQVTPRSGSDENLDTDNAIRTMFPPTNSASVRRAKSCPSRKLKYTKNAIMEDETT